MDQILSAVPHLRRGPGGVAAVVKDGKVVAKRAWGYADLDKRIPMSAQVAFPICSISKQMVCLVMISLLRNPTPRMAQRTASAREQMDAELRMLLPHPFEHENGSGLTLEHLAHMQSGIRDYWAMTTLWGAKPDAPFSMTGDASKTLSLTKSFHFPPGSEYSYSNVNFHLLGRILENVSGRSLAQLLVERVFIPADMSTAALCANTNGLPLPICGYEGDEKVGFFKALNRIEWGGDAGIAASLDDMIAYEKYLDRSWSEPESLYAITSQKPRYQDGSEAAYGYGLAHFKMADEPSIGHGGALRGFRHMRVHIPAKRLSVIVMLNFEADPGFFADHIVKRALSWSENESPLHQPAPEWKGDFLDTETQLYVTVNDGPKPGTLSVRYLPKEEVVKLVSPTAAESPSMSIHIDGDTLHAKRIGENRTLRARRIPIVEAKHIHHAASADYTGVYHCAESSSSFICTGGDGTLYGAFDGFLGQGPVWLMRYIGQDVWALGNPRGLDATPPGDWTVAFHRSTDGGKVTSCTVGCWLARKVVYARVK